MVLGQRIEGNYMLCDGIIRVFSDVEIKTIYHSGQYDSPITLDECLKQINHNNGVVTVIIENALKGDIFQYGNYGEYWVYHGKTNGYA